MGIESDTATVADPGSPSVPWSEPIRRLYNALTRLRPLAEQLEAAPPPDGFEWFQLLKNKLVPQVAGEPWLVVAVVGGTNIGKSVVFNHLVGENASAVSPRAAGTKHPVCLVPKHFADQHRLAELFSSFELRPWNSAEDALQEHNDHLLLWWLGRNVPPRLLLLDTPDIDSTAEVNWERADHVRQAADVLVAVLTMQKYNDAAVKKFFKHVADADKSVVIVFNQVDLEADRTFWPQWLDTFRDSTGVKPQLVYVVPYDRQAAERGELPFYDVGTDGRTPPGKPSSLRDELAAMHFSEIKLRTLRGALSVVLDDNQGAPAWLRSLASAAERFRKAETALNRWQGVTTKWPELPTALLRFEFLRWWDERRDPITRTIHTTYRKVGQGIGWVYRKLVGNESNTEETLLADYLRREKETVTKIFEQLFGELEVMASSGDPVLSPRLSRLLGGSEREALLRRLQQAHDQLPPLSDDFRRYLRNEFDQWAKSNPGTFMALRIADKAAAGVRPAITTTLAIVGGGPLFDVAANQALDLAITVGGGEAIAGAAGQGATHALAQVFLSCLREYTRQRAEWFTNWLRTNLLGELLNELQQGAQITSTEEYRQVQQALADLRHLTAA